MDVFHLLLGRLWQYDRKAKHDGHKNIYVIEKDGISFTFTPFKMKVQKSKLGLVL